MYEILLRNNNDHPRQLYFSYCLSQILFQYTRNNSLEHKDLFHISTKLNIILSTISFRSCELKVTAVESPSIPLINTRLTSQFTTQSTSQLTPDQHMIRLTAGHKLVT